MPLLNKGSFNNYVDRFLAYFDHPPTSSRQFIYRGLFTKVDIWLTNHPPRPVYVVIERPLTKHLHAVNKKESFNFRYHFPFLFVKNLLFFPPILKEPLILSKSYNSQIGMATSDSSIIYFLKQSIDTWTWFLWSSINDVDNEGRREGFMKCQHYFISLVK